MGEINWFIFSPSILRKNVTEQTGPNCGLGLQGPLCLLITITVSVPLHITDIKFPKMREARKQIINLKVNK